MVLGINKVNGRSHGGIPYPGKNKYTGMVRFSHTLRSTYSPKMCGVFVKNTSKILSFLVGVLTSCERPLCCVRDLKSSLLMSQAIINLAFSEVARKLSQELTKKSIKAFL